METFRSTLENLAVNFSSVQTSDDYVTSEQVNLVSYPTSESLV